MSAWIKRFRRPEADPAGGAKTSVSAGDAGEETPEAGRRGLSDEVASYLTRRSSLRVVRLTPEFEADNGLSRSEVAKRLHVDSILDGSVVRTGSRQHLVLHLVATTDASTLWTKTYERGVDDIVALPREAADALAQVLHSAQLPVAPSRAVLPAAHDAYMRGRSQWLANDFEAALPNFERAVALQPDFSLGWTGLSLYYGGSTMSGNLRPEESMKILMSTAERAVELDDSSPEAHFVLGSAYLLVNADEERADKELLRSIALNPRFVEVHHLRAKMLAAFGRHDEAIREQRTAYDLNPLMYSWGPARADLLARRFDQALEEAQTQVKLTPGDVSAQAMLSFALYRVGRYREAANARAVMAALAGGPAEGSKVRTAFVRGGYRAIQQADLKELLDYSKKHYKSPVKIAEAYAALGQRKEALASLEAAYKERSPLLLWTQCSPEFDFLHDDPRYQAVVKGMHLHLTQH